MKKDDVIAYLGSVQKLSELINCDRRAIYQWGELVPEPRQYEIEVKTDRQLLSDYSISRQALSAEASNE